MDNHEFAKRLNVWLSAYTNEVIEKVMKNIGPIRSDDTTSQLLENLYQATIAKEIDTERSFGMMLDSIDYDRYEYITIQDRTSRINSYRDVLYDLYIK